MQNPGWIPEWLAFIRVTDEIHVALIYQLLILEFAIDGLRLAAVNTPSMLTTPLSVIAGIVLGEYSVKSGWFNSETMLYMAFVTIANYSMTSFELGYALKFMRVLLLILTFFLNLWGFIAGTLIAVGCLVFNRTIAGKSYIYPLIPFHWSELKKRLLRNRLPHEEEKRVRMSHKMSAYPQLPGWFRILAVVYADILTSISIFYFSFLYTTSFSTSSASSYRSAPIEAQDNRSFGYPS